MIILGSERVVTQDYAIHKRAEDYSGSHLSVIKIKGNAKVIRVVNKYIVHEDTINSKEFYANQAKWKDGTYYNCISITGKAIRYHQSELGGNEVDLECYDGNKKRYFVIKHLATVNVNVGDIVTSDTIIGKQGNTGLVLSSRNKNDIAYGTHVHLEVKDENYQYLNPREYATFIKEVKYLEQTNVADNSKKQIKINADKINIRQSASKSSNDIGDVYNGEIYDVLGVSEDDIYTWYNIKTSLGLVGYVANEKGKNWLTVVEPQENIEDDIKEVDQPKQLKLIFTCEKDGMYAIKLKALEKLYIE